MEVVIKKRKNRERTAREVEKLEKRKFFGQKHVKSTWNGHVAGGKPSKLEEKRQSSVISSFLVKKRQNFSNYNDKYSEKNKRLYISAPRFHLCTGRRRYRPPVQIIAFRRETAQPSPGRGRQPAGRRETRWETPFAGKLAAIWFEKHGNSVGFKVN